MMFFRKQTKATRAAAFMAYLEFMEGRGPSSFTFPPGDYGIDQICGDVEGIILHQTRDWKGESYAARIQEFQRRRRDSKWWTAAPDASDADDRATQGRGGARRGVVALDALAKVIATNLEGDEYGDGIVVTLRTAEAVARWLDGGRAQPKLVKLKQPAGDAVMAETLLFLLDRVRSGKIKAFSICIIGERADGTEFSVESATAEGDDQLELQLLGVMRGAEQGLFRRRDDRNHP